MMLKARDIFVGLGVAVLMLLSGCEMGNVKTVLTVEGMVAKGPISNTTVTVTKAIDGTVLGNTTTDSRGYYEVETEIFYDQPVKVVANGGKYIDEITGQEIDASQFTLEAIASIGGDDKNIVNITPFTTISAKKITDAKNYTKEFVTTANTKIARIFTGNSFDVTKTIPNIINDTTDDSLTDKDSVLYGIILAGFAKDSNGSAFDVAAMLDEAQPGSYTGAVDIEKEELTAIVADKLHDTMTDGAITGDAVSADIDIIKNALVNSKDEKKPDIKGSAGAFVGVWDTETVNSWKPQNDGGNITSCEINASIVAGLTFDYITCEIKGKPTVIESVGKKYKITARNGLGSSEFVLTIFVEKKDRPITFPGEVQGEQTIVIKSKDSIPFDNMQVVDNMKINDLANATGDCVFTAVNPVSLNVASVVATTGMVSMGLDTGDAKIRCNIAETTYYKAAFAEYIVRSVAGAPDITDVINANIPAEFNTTLNWAITNTGGPVGENGCSTNVPINFGLDFNTSTCAITGKPNAIGSQVFTITASNGFAPDSVRQVTIDVQRIADSIDYGVDLNNTDINSPNIFKTVVPGGEGAGPGNITYSTSNPAVAQIVDATTGEFNITGYGSATLTATKAKSAHYKQATDTVNITVLNATAPAVVYPSCVPVNGAVAINNSDDITITWNRPVTYVNGKNVEVADQNISYTIGFSSGDISSNGNNIVLDVSPAVPLKNGHKYCVNIDVGAFVDAGGMATTDTIGQSLCFTTVSNIGPCNLDCVDNICF